MKLTAILFIGILLTVNGQFCGRRPNTIPTPNLCMPPPICTSPPTTTIIDNSVSLDLANAIQLMIVSNLLETTLPAVSRAISKCEPVSRPCLPPLLTAPNVPCYTSVERYYPYKTVETIPPIFYGGVTEALNLCGDYPSLFNVIETKCQMPNVYWTEIISPTPCSSFPEIITPIPPCPPPVMTVGPSLYDVEITPSPCASITPPCSSNVPPCSSTIYFNAPEMLTSYPSGFAELIAPPPMTEVFLPPPLCNGGYTPNVMQFLNEIPTDGCGCGNYFF